MPPTPIRNLDQLVTTLPNIGASYAKKLEKLNIFTLNDLLHHYPFRYSDLSATKSINELQEGDIITLSGTILSIKTAYLRSGKTIQRALFSDGTDTIDITWFNQPYLVKTFSHHPQISISGKVKRFGRKLTLSSPQYETVTNTQAPSTNHQAPNTNLHTGRLVPVYPETAGVSSKWIRGKINSLLKIFPQEFDYLPQDILTKYQLAPLSLALNQIHFPDDSASFETAKKRLSFDELLTHQLLSQIRKRERLAHLNHYAVHTSPTKLESFIKNLPFDLTDGQNQAITQILKDLGKTTPMNRLIQGDVGSGKTIVAAIAALPLIQQGFKVVFMVPTETLANQHFATLTKMFASHQINISLATKSSKGDLSQSDLIIGTHAVLHRKLPDPIGLVIIDEQHRFGVKQRNQLLDVANPPHLLSLTATPIPRTIALTLYAELDVTAIKDMPPGRIPVKTHVVPNHKRQSAYTWINQQIQAGGQAFIVCPLINSQDAFTDNEVKAVTTEYERLSQTIFPNLKLGMIHGKLPSKEKDLVIHQFASGDLDILVATPVIEVGIDIKNATIMHIEGAERFGLASLHQLRGRVGRGDKQSYCLLFPTSDKTQAMSRLKQMETHHNGLELAEIDLNLRGPGDLYGIRQSGYIKLKIASLHDLETIQLTHQAASEIMEVDPSLKSFPLIKSLVLQYLTLYANITNGG